MAILARSPKSPIFWKSAKGRPRELFSKIAQKVALAWKGQQHSLAQMSLASKLYPLIMQRLKKTLGQKAALKRPEWPSYNNFRNVTPDPHFMKKSKGGTKGNFSKIAQKVALVWKAQKHSGAKNIILCLVRTWSAKTAKDFGSKSGSKSARIAKLWQFSQGHPKAPFSEKVQRGDQGTFFKNRPKSGPPFKNPTALWRKWHYPLISMLL